MVVAQRAEKRYKVPYSWGQGAFDLRRAASPIWCSTDPALIRGFRIWTGRLGEFLQVREKAFQIDQANAVGFAAWDQEQRFKVCLLVKEPIAIERPFRIDQAARGT